MKPRTGPPPVDALSDGAWARVERALWLRLDQDADAPAPAPRRRLRWPWVAVPIAAFAAVVLVVATRALSVPAKDDPARVVAGAAPSSVSFGDAHIALEARAAILMEADRHTVLLETGAAWFTVAPRGDRPAFEVRAGDATIRVIGTRFRVARDGEQIGVEVDHGIVGVEFRGSRVELGSGQSWSSVAPDRSLSPPDGGLASVTPSPAPAIAAPSTPSPEVAAAPPMPPAAPKPASACDADCARYQALAKLEVTQPEVAIKGYLALSQGSGTWAAVSLFAAGRLAADRHDVRARALLSIYLHRFPAGANAADAAELLTRLKGTSP